MDVDLEAERSLLLTSVARHNIPFKLQLTKRLKVEVVG